MINGAWNYNFTSVTHCLSLYLVYHAVLIGSSKLYKFSPFLVFTLSYLILSAVTDLSNIREDSHSIVVKYVVDWSWPSKSQSVTETFVIIFWAINIEMMLGVDKALLNWRFCNTRTLVTQISKFMGPTCGPSGPDIDLKKKKNDGDDNNLIECVICRMLLVLALVMQTDAIGIWRPMLD